MRKFLIFLFLPLVFSSPKEILASTAKSVVETQVESSGETQVYQSVETTVDGETVRKESNEPGTLELVMKKEGESEPTVTFSQTSGNLTPSRLEPLFSLADQIRDFVRKLLANLMLRFTQHQP